MRISKKCAKHCASRLKKIKEKEEKGVITTKGMKILTSSKLCPTNQTCSAVMPGKTLIFLLETTLNEWIIKNGMVWRREKREMERK